MTQLNLVPLPQPPPAVDQRLSLAKVFAESGLFPDVRTAAQAFVKVQAGAELDLPPFASMTGVHLIKGKVALSAVLIAGLIRRSGRYDYRVRQHDDTRCSIEFLLDGRPVGESTFSMEDARKAGLAGGDNWRKYAKNMLFSRAMTNGAKWHCPDVFGGPVYSPDELGGEVDGETGEVVVVTARPAVITAEQGEEIQRLVLRKGADLTKLLAHYGIGSLGEMTIGQLDDAVGRLQQRPDVCDTPAGEVPGGDEDDDPKETE